MQQLIVILPIKYNGCNPLFSINTGTGATRGLSMLVFYLILRAVSVEERQEHDYYQLSSPDYLFIRTQAGQQPTLSGEEGGGKRREVLSRDKDTTLTPPR